MGQRHQIYFILPSDDNSRKVAGLHHQWLYGSGPLRKLDQLLTFIKRAIDDGNTGFGHANIPSWMAYDHHVGDYTDSETVRALHAIYSLDPETGGFKSLHTLTDGETADPRLGDNNDGITILDLRDPAAPRFTFATFAYGKSGATVKLLTASQYLAGYYTQGATDNSDYKLAPEGSWQLAEKLDAMGPTMTRVQLRKLFPDMFARKTK